MKDPSDPPTRQGQPPAISETTPVPRDAQRNSILEFAYFIVWTSEDPYRFRWLGTRVTHRRLRCALLTILKMPTVVVEGLEISADQGLFRVEDGRFVLAPVPAPPLNTLDFGPPGQPDPTPVFLTREEVQAILRDR